MGRTRRCARPQSWLEVISCDAEQQGVPYGTFYTTGESVSDEIIEAATGRDCDLISMASHGRRGITGLLLGSETMHVLTHRKVPVLVQR